MNCMNLVLLVFVSAQLPGCCEDDGSCTAGEFCKKIAVDNRLVARSMDL